MTIPCTGAILTPHPPQGTIVITLNEGPVAQRERASIALRRSRVQIPPGPLSAPLTGNCRARGTKKLEGPIAHEAPAGSLGAPEGSK